MAKERIRDVDKPRMADRIREDLQPQKEGRSFFDKVLEQNRLMQKSPQQIQVKLGQGEHQETRVFRNQDQGGRGKDRQSDEKEQERGKQKAREERKSETNSEQRVGGSAASLLTGVEEG